MRWVQRLSPLDSSFLRVETPTAHMHVGWLATLLLPEGCESLDVALLTKRIEARLHLAPRFRQRLAPAPIGEPRWADDERFAIARHLHVLGGEPPTRAELDDVAGRFLSVQLARDRALWAILVVPRVAGTRRAAILGKVHHAMVDGVAAVELGTMLFDLAPDAAPPVPEDWHPERSPGALGLTAGAVVEGAVEQFRAARRAVEMGLTPRRSLRVAETLRRAALQVAEDVINPAPPSFLNPSIGPRRSLVNTRLPIDRMLRVKERRAVKLNDVVLATVAGALRQFAVAHGEAPHPIRVMVPVNVRRDGDAGGNRITLAFLDLPLDEARPLRRLAVIHGRTQELKRSGRVAGGDVLMRGIGQLPGFVKERAARLAASPRMYNVTVSNVPGPRAKLFAAGAEVEAIYPVIPIADEHALAVGVVTYGDAIHFSCFVDPEALPAAPELPALIEESAAELERASTRRRHPPRRRHRDQGARANARVYPSHRGSSKPAYS